MLQELNIFVSALNIGIMYSYTICSCQQGGLTRTRRQYLSSEFFSCIKIQFNKTNLKKITLERGNKKINLCELFVKSAVQKKMKQVF